MLVSVNREEIEFKPDSSRVIPRFFCGSKEKNERIIRAVLKMPEDKVVKLLSQILRGYSSRHRNISKVFERHFQKIASAMPGLNSEMQNLTLLRKDLIGAYFTNEFSIEAAAFFNPSIIKHPDQSELSPGETRVAVSFRATGEGHISSLVFRSGILDKNNNLTLDAVGKMVDEAETVIKHRYKKSSFLKEVDFEMDSECYPVCNVFNSLDDTFTYGDLKRTVAQLLKTLKLNKDEQQRLQQTTWLASNHYEINFSYDTSISERVLFPISETEKNGIEDARFVEFTKESGKTVYYATYTAYDGKNILPKLIRTRNFYHFDIIPIHGEIAQNKGMALFPRKINGKYAMLCRIDGSSNYISFSDNLITWRTAAVIQKPKYDWELIQSGNCGSPIETKDGWLVITHGVGPMRKYAIGASLFDLDDPCKEIGRLSEPLMIPTEEEREGYVPNVIYSCGSMIHNGSLIIPYAMSDAVSTYAHVSMEELLSALKSSK